MKIELNNEEGCTTVKGVVRSKLKKQSGVVILNGGNYDTEKKQLNASLQKSFKDVGVVILHVNDFLYKTKGRRAKESPEAINWKRLSGCVSKLRSGESVSVPKYNPITHEIEGSEIVQGRVIIVWGVFALHDSLLPLADVRVYCKSDKFCRLVRYFLSELKNLSPDEIAQSLLSGNETNKSVVEPTARFANYVLINNKQPSFSGKHARKLVDSFRVAGKIDMFEMVKARRATKGETKIQDEYFIFSPDKTQIVRLRKNAIAFMSKLSNEASEVWYEFQIAEHLIKQLVELYKAECLHVSKARTIYRIVGSRFRVYVDNRVVITRGKRSKEIGDYSGIIRSRFRCRQVVGQDIEEVKQMFGLQNEQRASAYYEMLI